MLRLFDTLRRAKVALEPLQEGRLGIYVCGPTVYDACHIGHARCYVAFDVIVRHLRHRGLDVSFVRNVTDVDDKIIARAAEAGEDPIALAARMTEAFHGEMALLGNVPPDVEPRVSEHIPDVIALIEKLVAAGRAYATGGDVFFSVESFPSYGALSGRNLAEQQEGARVEVDPRKRHPFDFALWKAAKPGEPSWDSPWGAGRPGWHIECSAMSSRYLGDTFDIHGGGMDLIFPHHENEIAQSQGAHGTQTFARHWLHNGFINIGGEKMSKSLGNFFTIREVCAQHEPEALRLFLLGTSYRSPITFEVERTDTGVRYPSLDDAEQRLSYAYGTLARMAAVAPKDAAPGADALPPAREFSERFRAAMDDDFNTAAALGHASELLTLANKLLDQPKSLPKPVRRSTLAAIAAGLGEVAAVLGVYGQDPGPYLTRRRDRLCAQHGIDAAQVEARLQERTEARRAKDFARADQIRDELAAMRVEVMDSAGGSSWRVLEG